MSEVFVEKLLLIRTRVDYQGFFLGMVCMIMTLSLLIGDRQTSASISERLMEDRLVTLGQVLPVTLYDNNPVTEAVVVHDELIGDIEVYPATLAGKFSGIAFQVKTIGYGGEMTMMFGVKSNGEITGVRVLSHKETPGLADKIEIAKSSWIKVFDGKSLDNTPEQEWAVKKDGGKIDQFTGATITPRAVVKGVRAGLAFYARHKSEFQQSHR